MIPVDYKHNFKFIVIGASGVGKTSLVKRLVEDQFIPETAGTIGVEYIATTLEVDGQPIKLQIWDTAGQEKFRSIAKSYFRHAVGVILVFDITSRKSFEDLSVWLNDVHQLCDSNAAITLIGNKLDLGNQRAVTSADAQVFAANHQTIYIETSARGGDNVAEAFQRAAKLVYDRAEAGVLATKTAAPSGNNTAGNGGSGCGCRIT
jgi:small GTP-binding protein